MWPLWLRPLDDGIKSRNVRAPPCVTHCFHDNHRLETLRPTCVIYRKWLWWHPLFEDTLFSPSFLFFPCSKQCLFIYTEIDLHSDDAGVFLWVSVYFRSVNLCIFNRHTTSCLVSLMWYGKDDKWCILTQSAPFALLLPLINIHFWIFLY